ncbi:MAG: sulfite exporter TauE/SafE family protein, partial [Planctomycetes bacterium]|nr:sulfite exporter TauE/SafE family protein [Planctomycetota bacterium]
MSPLSLIFGAVVGLSLGLTGGGGAIFAVPLLVYGLHIPAKDAVVISLISVGSTSFVGFLHRWQLKEVDVKTGLIFAVAGMIGAPIGAWLATLIPDVAL